MEFKVLVIQFMSDEQMTARWMTVLHGVLVRETLNLPVDLNSIHRPWSRGLETKRMRVRIQAAKMRFLLTMCAYSKLLQTDIDKILIRTTAWLQDEELTVLLQYSCDSVQISPLLI